MASSSLIDQRSPREAALNLDMAVETPENVLLSYQVAGPSARCLAYGLDSIVRAIILALALLVAVWSSQYLPGVTWGFVMVLIFALEWGYHVFCEGLFRGKTIGKDALGLRVVQLEGYPITFWSAMQRNLMRAVDGVPIFAFLALAGRPLGETFSLSANLSQIWSVLIMLPVYGPALVSMVLTRRFQRLGDLVAGTVVISERQTRLSREPVIISRIEPLSREEIGRFVPDPETLALIDEFLTRREELTYDRGHELCSRFAMTLARRLEFEGDHYQLRDYPMAFLARVYVTFTRTDDSTTSEDPWTATEGNSIVVVSTYDVGKEDSRG
jgi:uncharacterized RDD family membrane protein YckC